MKDYFEEVSERAELVKRSRGRVAKSSRCRLPSDSLTQKEWNAMNGAVISFNPDKPMTYPKFKLLPEHLQKEYLGGLQVKYNFTLTQLGEMFGISGPSAGRILRKLGIPAAPANIKRDQSQHDKWNDFLGKGETAQKQAEIPKQAAQTAAAASDVASAFTQFAQTAKEALNLTPYKATGISTLQLTLRGTTLDDLRESLTALVPLLGAGRSCTITIRVTPETD